MTLHPDFFLMRVWEWINKALDRAEQVKYPLNYSLRVIAKNLLLMVDTGFIRADDTLEEAFKRLLVVKVR